MKFYSAVVSLLSALVLSEGFGVSPQRSSLVSVRSGSVSLSSTAEKTDGKKAGDDAPPVNLGWDTHQAIDEAPESLVREEDGPDGNYPMRAKMEKMLREAQISITKGIAEIDGASDFAGRLLHSRVLSCHYRKTLHR